MKNEVANPTDRIRRGWSGGMRSLGQRLKGATMWDEAGMIDYVSWSGYIFIERDGRGQHHGNGERK